MTAPEIKAALEHGCSDLEAIATELNHPEAAAMIEKFKSLLESPLALDGLALAVSFGLSKIGAAAAEPAKAPTA